MSRALRLGLMFTGALLCLAVVIKALSLGLHKPISACTLWMLSAMAAFIVVAGGTAIRTVVSLARQGKWQKEAYSYENEDHSEGRQIDAKNEAIMDRALARDYVQEYSKRMWREPSNASDIANIQKRLDVLRKQREDLRGKSDFLTVHRRRKVESEAADLLGKLTIRYRFSNGFHECPMNLLFQETDSSAPPSNAENGEAVDGTLSQYYHQNWAAFTQKLRKLMKDYPSMPVVILQPQKPNVKIDCAVAYVHDPKTDELMEKVIAIYSESDYSEETSIEDIVAPF